MRLSEVKKKLTEDGILDSRGLFCYATAAGTQNGKTFQTLVGCVFHEDFLALYKADLGGSVTEEIVRFPFQEIRNFKRKDRFWYSSCSLSCGIDTMRFYNYDKKVFRQGFQRLEAKEYTP